MLTVNDIAENLNVSTRTVRLWIEDGKLQAYKFGKDYRIEPEDLKTFIEKSKVSNVKNDVE